MGIKDELQGGRTEMSAPIVAKGAYWDRPRLLRPNANYLDSIGCFD